MGTGTGETGSAIQADLVGRSDVRQEKGLQIILRGEKGCGSMLDTELVQFEEED